MHALPELRDGPIVRNVILGTLGYAATFAGASLLLAAIGVSQHVTGGSGPADNWYTGAIIILGVGACASIGFALVTACSSAWRRGSARFAASLGAAAAALAFVLWLIGVGPILAAILVPSSLMRTMPKLGGFIAFAVPGVLGGLVAIFVAARRERRDAGKSSPD